MEEFDDVEEGGDGGAEREPEHIEGLNPAGKDFHLCGLSWGVGVGRSTFRGGREEAGDPGEERDVDYHEGADIEVGEDVGDCVGDLDGGMVVSFEFIVDEIGWLENELKPVLGCMITGPASRSLECCLEG